MDVEAVVVVFMIDDSQRNDTGSQTDGKPKKIDKGVEFVAQEVAQGDYEAVGERDPSPTLPETGREK